LLLVAVVNASVEQEFQDWMKQYNKHYDSEVEYLHRFSNYKQNLLRYALLNAKSESVIHGPTKFADMTHE